MHLDTKPANLFLNCGRQVMFGEVRSSASRHVLFELAQVENWRLWVRPAGGWAAAPGAALN